MSMTERLFGRKLFHEHLVRDSFVKMVGRVFGQRLFHAHNSESFWSEALL